EETSLASSIRRIADEVVADRRIRLRPITDRVALLDLSIGTRVRRGCLGGLPGRRPPDRQLGHAWTGVHDGCPGRAPTAFRADRTSAPRVATLTPGGTPMASRSRYTRRRLLFDRCIRS